jgi:hypothetical protein
VDKNVSLILGFNKTITLFVVEPFHAAFRHLSNSFPSLVLFPLLAVSLLRAILAKLCLSQSDPPLATKVEPSTPLIYMSLQQRLKNVKL